MFKVDIAIPPGVPGICSVPVYPGVGDIGAPGFEGVAAPPGLPGGVAPPLFPAAAVITLPN